MTNYKRNFYLLLVIAFIAAISLGYYTFKQHVQITQKNEQVLALTDTVRLYKTKYGASGAERRIFSGTKDDVLTVLKSQDAKAYDAVKNTPGIHTYTDFTTVTRIDTVVKADTVYMLKDTTGKLTYVLSKEIKEPKGFYDAKVDVLDDSVALKVQMNDTYHIISKDKSNGFLKPKSYVVTVENENPYVNITTVKSFTIAPENKYLGLKIGVVVVVGLGAFLLLKR